MRGKIGVFIVDDSAIVRTTIAKLLENEQDIALLGAASDPIIAQSKFERNGWPDVIILDIEMPRMDGLTFLKKIMSERPTPVIICSSVAQSGSPNAIEALSCGAVEVIAKPQLGLKAFLEESKYSLIDAIKASFESKNRVRRINEAKQTTDKVDADAILTLKNKTFAQSRTHTVIAIGSSTGGVQALEKILPFLPQKTPPILITQHMPPGFTNAG